MTFVKNNSFSPCSPHIFTLHSHEHLADQNLFRGLHSVDCIIPDHKSYWFYDFLCLNCVAFANQGKVQLFLINKGNKSKLLLVLEWRQSNYVLKRYSNNALSFFLWYIMANNARNGYNQPRKTWFYPILNLHILYQPTTVIRSYEISQLHIDDADMQKHVVINPVLCQKSFFYVLEKNDNEAVIMLWELNKLDIYKWA